MRVAYVVLFAILAVAICLASWPIAGEVWVVLPLWCSVSAMALSHEYWRDRGVYLRKNSHGRLAIQSWLVMLPFLLLARVVWHLQRQISKERPWDEVVPGLFISRRLLPGELPEGVELVVDLTAEFGEPRAIREACDYLCRPILDATAPANVELEEIVARIVEHTGPVLVHCANGHGRSALVVAATLIKNGMAKDTTEAIGLVKAARPAVRLNRDQRRAGEEFAKSRPGRSMSPTDISARGASKGVSISPDG